MRAEPAAVVNLDDMRTEVQLRDVKQEFWKRYEDGKKHADLRLSDSYLAKRLLQRARITPGEKKMLLSRVDGDWSQLHKLDDLLGRLCKYDKKSGSQIYWTGDDDFEEPVLYQEDHANYQALYPNYYAPSLADLLRQTGGANDWSSSASSAAGSSSAGGYAPAVHTLIVLSTDPDKIVFPSGEKATEVILSLCALVFSLFSSSVAVRRGK